MFISGILTLAQFDVAVSTQSMTQRGKERKGNKNGQARVD